MKRILLIFFLFHSLLNGQSLTGQQIGGKPALRTSGTLINISDNAGLNPSSSISFDGEAAAFISRCQNLGANYSLGRQTLINNVFKMFKDSLGITSLSQLFDGKYFTDNYRVGHPEDTNIVKLNWVKDAYNLSSFGLLAYDSSGIKGNESSSGLRTNYVPSVNGSAYTLDSSSFGVFAKKTEKVNRSIIGGYQTGVLQRLFLVNGTAAINSASQYSSGFTDTLGMTIVSRTSSTTVKIYGDLTWVVTDTRNSSALPSVEQGLLCENANGTYTNFSAATVGFAFWGAELDATQVRIINNVYLYWRANKNLPEYQ